MKRDKELIRDLMLHIESTQKPGEDISFGRGKTFNDTPIEELFYHLKLIQDAGFIDLGTYETMGGSEYDIYSIRRITNSGHDFIDAIRDEGVWNKVKEKLGDAGAFSLGIIKELGTAYLKEKLGLAA